MAHIGSEDTKNLLIKYGISNPTDQEIAMFTGMDVIGGAATAAIAEYANYVKAEQTRQASDPLVAYQQLEQKYASDSIAQAKNLYTQLQDLQSSAPKLFGEFTPDQIQQYLKPLQSAFQTSLSSVQSILASRGLGASSTEANAVAQTGQQFNENVLQTGLNIGLTSQQNKAQSMQQQINSLFQIGNNADARAGGAAGQISAQNLGQSNLIASLPYYLRSTGEQEAASLRAEDKANQGGLLQRLSYAADVGKLAVDPGMGYTALGVKSGAQVFGTNTNSTPSTPAAGSQASTQQGFMGSPSAPGGTVFGSDPPPATKAAALFATV